MRLNAVFAALIFLASAVFCASQGAVAAESGAASSQLDPENTLYLDLAYGRVVIRMRPDWAPKHVARIKHLVREGFYDGVPFHRVIEGFMAQTGDPSGTGAGGSGRMIDAEFTGTPQVRGVVAMARAGGKNSADSQWFIVLADSRPALDGKYTAWGQVVSGMEFVDKIRKGDPNRDGKVSNPDRVNRLQVAADVDQSVAPANREELLRQPAAAAAARDFSASEVRCVALNDRPGSARDAAVAQFWTQGYLAGSYKAQERLTYSADATEAPADNALHEACTAMPQAFLLPLANQELLKTTVALPAATATLPVAHLTCKDFIAARKGANADQAAFAELWAFAYIQGYKNVGQPNMEIPFQARAQLMDAVAGACVRNADMGFADLVSLVAAKVKLK